MQRNLESGGLSWSIPGFAPECLTGAMQPAPSEMFSAGSGVAKGHCGFVEELGRCSRLCWAFRTQLSHELRSILWLLGRFTRGSCASIQVPHPWESGSGCPSWLPELPVHPLRRGGAISVPCRGRALRRGRRGRLSEPPLRCRSKETNCCCWT